MKKLLILTAAFITGLSIAQADPVKNNQTVQATMEGAHDGHGRTATPAVRTTNAATSQTARGSSTPTAIVTPQKSNFNCRTKCFSDPQRDTVTKSKLTNTVLITTWGALACGISIGYLSHGAFWGILSGAAGGVALVLGIIWITCQLGLHGEDA